MNAQMFGHGLGEQKRRAVGRVNSWLTTAEFVSFIDPRTRSRFDKGDAMAYATRVLILSTTSLTTPLTRVVDITLPTDLRKARYLELPISIRQFTREHASPFRAPLPYSPSLFEIGISGCLFGTIVESATSFTDRDSAIDGAQKTLSEYGMALENACNAINECGHRAGRFSRRRAAYEGRCVPCRLRHA
jgi:hypothetical protein